MDWPVGVRPPKRQPPPLKYFEPAEVIEILRQIRSSPLPAAEHHADLIEVLARTGIRHGELARLRVKDAFRKLSRFLYSCLLLIRTNSGISAWSSSATSARSCQAFLGPCISMSSRELGSQAKKLIQRLREKRIARGLSVDAVVEQLRKGSRPISRNTLVNLESGTHDPRYQLAEDPPALPGYQQNGAITDSEGDTWCMYVSLSDPTDVYRRPCP